MLAFELERARFQFTSKDDVHVSNVSICPGKIGAEMMLKDLFIYLFNMNSYTEYTIK